MVIIADAAPQPLYGRREEQRILDRLLTGGRDAVSGVLVVRGEFGIGKTSMLDYAARASKDFRIARTRGVETDSKLRFSALQSLCGQFEGQLDHLSTPQSEALQVALGLRHGESCTPLLVGLAVLKLLSGSTESKPILWLIDDAQYLDHASAQVLGFVARRLRDESAVMLFAAGTGGDTSQFTGLRTLDLASLRNLDARALLAKGLSGRIDSLVTDRIVLEAHGNPLALVQLPHTSTAAEMAGGFAVPRMPLCLGDLKTGIAERILKLPSESRLLLLIAAAEPLGDSALLWAAAELLGVGESAVNAAEAGGLIFVGHRVLFRHSFLRSAVYHSARPLDRRSVHRALAEVTDAAKDRDRRAWHRAEAAVVANEGVAADLELSAGQAQVRGGIAANAAFMDRAVSLTPDPARRALRALAAATSKLAAGEPDAVRDLARIAREGLHEPTQLAKLELIETRADVLLTQDFGAATGRFLKLAARIAPLDASLSRDAYLEAIESAVHASGSLDAGEVRAAAAAAIAAPAAGPSTRAVDLLLHGMVARVTGGALAGTEPLRRAVAALREVRHIPIPGAALDAAYALYDYETWAMFAGHNDRVARRSEDVSGSLAVANDLVGVELCRGRLDIAGQIVEESDRLRLAIGAAPSHAGSLVVAGWRGCEEQTLATIRAATLDVGSRGCSVDAHLVAYATAVQYNALGRYDVALAGLKGIGTLVPDGVQWLLPEIIEAAMRMDNLPLSEMAFRQLSAAAASGTDWGLGTLARCRALMTDRESAELSYVEAINRLGRADIALDLARSHLVYGEWLRRERRRGDAREQLRTAYDMFAEFGAQAFADRAGRELRSTGERIAPVSSPDLVQRLTPQQSQIARLAATGLTNQEIATRLFISRRTVEYHFGNIFAKLNITSRAQIPATAG